MPSDGSGLKKGTPTPPTVTSRATRSGCDAATLAEILPPSEFPMTAARSIPRPSKNATTASGPCNAGFCVVA